MEGTRSHVSAGGALGRSEPVEFCGDAFHSERLDKLGNVRRKRRVRVGAMRRKSQELRLE